MTEDNRYWPCRILDLVNKRADIGTSTLEALKNIPLVLDAGIAANAFDNHKLITLIPDYRLY